MLPALVSPRSYSVRRGALAVDSYIHEAGQNMKYVNSHTHDKIAGMHTRGAAGDHPPGRAAERLDFAIADFNEAVKAIEAQCETPGADMQRLGEELKDQLLRVETFCREVQQQLGDDREAIRKKQREFRQRTDAFFAKSFFMHRARNWPLGYPGDYEIIENAYNNQPLSRGVGQLFDQYFLTTTLANGIRYRRALMREILAEEMRARRAPRILNIGCGPCRELVELAPTIRESGAHFTCVDFDPDALAYSAERLRSCGLEDSVQLRHYNALRMINAERNIREFGRFDVIYTIGLLDYLTDDVLVRMIKSLYDTLEPAGVFIAVFKDCDRYDTIDYHWLVDWSGFLQRTRHESWHLIEAAGIPRDAVTVQRTQDDVMIFYRILRRAAVLHSPLAHGAHDPRDQQIEPVERHPAEPAKRSRRETPSERRRR
jgi:extracellular factor (EF) 3-hydroxypalmitic acid methyl ester biosynthesis protein